MKNTNTCCPESWEREETNRYSDAQDKRTLARVGYLSMPCRYTNPDGSEMSADWKIKGLPNPTHTP